MASNLWDDLQWPHLLFLVMSSPWVWSRPKTSLLKEKQWQKWWGHGLLACLSCRLSCSVPRCSEKSQLPCCELSRGEAHEGRNEGLAPAAWEELTSGHSHVMTLDMDCPPGEPSDETAALADAWFAACWETLRQGPPAQPHLVPPHRNSDHINVRCFCY